MSGGAKVAVVGGGYALAFAAAAVAGVLYDARMSAMPYDTSGGMYAGGQLLTSLGVFFVGALPPTLVWLWFERANRRFWQSIGLVSLVFAAAGLVAVLMPLVIPGTPRHPALMVLDLLGLTQLLGMPLWTTALILFAFLAPTRPVRRLLVTAIGIELVIGVCALFHWFVPSSPL